MAAVTATDKATTVEGNHRVHYARLPATFADADTYDTGLTRIEYVFASPVGETAAADVSGVASYTGGVLTLQMVGTARELHIRAVGI
jgi:hypothetical protein